MRLALSSTRPIIENSFGDCTAYGTAGQGGLLSPPKRIVVYATTTSKFSPAAERARHWN